MVSVRKVRFDTVEVLLLLVLVAVVAWKVGVSRPEVPPGMWELDQFAAKYGPARNSEHGEEWIVRDFFNDKRAGFFVDVGANDYKAESNTYYLETALGWSGIAIEPQRQFAAGYAAHRPQTKFRPFFVSDESNKEAKLYVLEKNTLVTSADKQFNAKYGEGAKELTAPTITLNDLLDSEKVTAIDFLTMDIELWEPKALAGFDVERFKPALVCIEAHPQVRQQILDYFALHSYTVVGRYLRADAQNLYFMPRVGL
jgi:FkbM family methyltransferase